MKCAHCGAENLDNGRFCQRCGEDLRDVAQSIEVVPEPLPQSPYEAPSYNPAEPKRSPSKFVRFFITAFVSLCLCAASAFIVYSIMNHKVASISMKLDEAVSLLQDVNDDLYRLNKDYNKLDDDYAQVWEWHDEAMAKADLYYEKASFLDESIALVTETGKKYHTYDCHFFKDCKSYWAYNVENAEYQGYRPCSECH